MSPLLQLILLANLQLSLSFTIRNTQLMSPQQHQHHHRSSSSSLTAHQSNSNSTSDDNTNTPPAYTFGLLTDIQHAPIPDGHSFTGNARYYRHAMEAAASAAQHFQEERVNCVVNLGDIIDGKCADVQRWGGEVDVTTTAATAVVEETSNGDKIISVGHDAIDNVLQALSVYSGKILHTYGNHELYNLSRDRLAEKLNIPFTLEDTGDLVGYYTHLIENCNQNEEEHSSSSSMKLRALVLDTYDLCLLDRCPDSSHKRHRAHEILSANNHNYPHEENSPEGLEGTNRRFVAFNGGIDEPQLEWLRNSLEMARENEEKVIVFSHQPIHPDSTWPTCLVWNYDEVLDILRSYKDVIIASFSGHAHKGGYVRDEESGIHFRSVEAILESSPPIKTYAIVDVFEDKLVIRGEGDCLSDVYDIDHTKVKLKV
uniref:Calcineurin-like phosphoesterase domain-containing protein n=1 Tax=Skeletonema marinoi TaxID=267567 RepID=A0A7S1CU47_9STRA|mmetsp:Transcript_2302/g.3398  ORF Transcript_2302/g.3398 Transcript_2302/m.3398 type:complete len:427 (+) Transcript_2302:63-1343(+)